MNRANLGGLLATVELLLRYLTGHNKNSEADPPDPELSGSGVNRLLVGS